MSLGDLTPFGALVRAVLAPGAIQGMTALSIRSALAEYRGFNQGLDVARRTFGSWDMRDPIEDMKPSHAGVVAFRSVFS